MGDIYTRANSAFSRSAMVMGVDPYMNALQSKAQKVAPVQTVKDFSTIYSLDHDVLQHRCMFGDIVPTCSHKRPLKINLLQFMSDIHIKIQTWNAESGVYGGVLHWGSGCTAWGKRP